MTVAAGDATLDEAIEQIDIGGVALIRAAAKNFEHVTVLVDSSQYAQVIDAPHGVDRATRRTLATCAFERTAEYDSSIARYLEAGLPATDLPGSLALTLPLATPLRYGENPQSRAAFYLSRTDVLPEQLSGKSLSYNNYSISMRRLRLLLVRAHVPGTMHALGPRHSRARGRRQTHGSVRRRRTIDRRRGGATRHRCRPHLGVWRHRRAPRNGGPCDRRCARGRLSGDRRGAFVRRRRAREVAP